MSELTLYHYWRSTSSWRVRFALELKKINAKLVHVSLLDGESESPEHLKRHPLGFVPVLQVEGRYLIESVAIIDWLDKTYGPSNFYPGDALNQAHVRTLVEVINSGIQPLHNLSVLEHYSDDPEKRKAWAQHYIKRGLKAYETLVKKKSGIYSVGDSITAADLFLIPQCHGAKRFEVDLSDYPTIAKINEAVMKTAEAQASAPEKYEPKKA